MLCDNVNMYKYIYIPIYNAKYKVYWRQKNDVKYNNILLIFMTVQVELFIYV